MARCPSGHESATSDYCDTCGVPIAGASQQFSTSEQTQFAAAGATHAATATSSPATASGSASAQPDQFCPRCRALRDGRFCEECGYDYDLAALVPNPPPTLTQQPATEQSPFMVENLAQTQAYDPYAEQALSQTQPFTAFDPQGNTAQFPAVTEPAPPQEANEQATPEESPQPLTPDPPPDPTQALPIDPATATPPTGAEQSPAPSSPQGGALIITVTADPEYYAAQVQRGDIDEAEYPFPKYPQDRRFELQGDRVRIGRPSTSRGITVEIDLTGPPLDPAVSHLHAQILRAPDGTWSVVDLNSSNGTRINGAADPIAPETEHPVAAGDQIHLGVWTTLTIEEA